MMIYPGVILCGGFGTRLRSVVGDRPKVLAPVGGKPFLGHLLSYLSRQGLTDVVLSTGYMGEMIEAFAGNGEQWKLNLTYIREPEPLGTGGALRFVQAEMGWNRPFLAMNGDTFFSGSINRLTAFHRASGASSSLALVRVPDARRFGTVIAAEDGRIESFREKRPDAEGGAWINAGVYVLEPRLLATLPPGEPASLERDIFPQWISKGLSGCRFPDAVFLDIGTPEDYARAPGILDDYDDRARS